MKPSLLLALFLSCSMAQGQVLPVSVVTQEQTNWCWAAVSKCLLNYYGDTATQCAIAEFTRTTATWHNYGISSCCDDPSLGCNYVNNNAGSPGSIQDIIPYFGGYPIYEAPPLSFLEMKLQLGHYTPFICYWRWAVYVPSGHDVVTHGIDDTNYVHYMDPAPGEGEHICTFNWMSAGSPHLYQWTLIFDHCPKPLPPTAGTIVGKKYVIVGSSATLSDALAGGTWSSATGKVNIVGNVVTGVVPGFDTVLYNMSSPCGITSARLPMRVYSTSVEAGSVNPENEMDIFPNPVHDELFVTGLRSEATYRIFNPAGKCMLQGTTAPSNATLSLGTLPSGLYILDILRADGERKILKVVKE